MKKKNWISEREYQDRLKSCLESPFNTQTEAAEVTQDRNQKAESAEREGRKRFRAHETKHDGFGLTKRPYPAPTAAG
jgi:hypothetical protein